MAGSRPDGGYDIAQYTADLDAVQSYLGMPWRAGGYGVGVLGDSRMAQTLNDGPTPWPSTLPPTSSDAHVKTTHFLNWCSALSGGSMSLRSVQAVSGLRTDQYDDYLDALIAQRPRIIFVFSVVNDIGQNGTTGDTAQTIFDRVKAIVYKIRRAGIIPVLFTEPGATTLSAAQVKMVHDYNKLLLELAETDWGFLVFDLASIVWDAAATSTTAIAIKSGYSSDGTHYTALGNYWIGKALASFMAAFLQAYPDIVATSTYVHANDGGELVNPLFLTTTTSGLPTGFSGTMPANWIAASSRTGSGTVTASVVAAPDGIGNAVRLVVAGAAIGDQVRFGQDATSANFSAGNFIDFGVKAIINSGAENLRHACLYGNVGGPPNPMADLFNPVSAALSSDLNGKKLAMRSVPYCLPTGFTWIDHRTLIEFAVAGGCDITIWGPMLRKRNAF